MSVSKLLRPSAKSQAWSSLYANSLDVNSVIINNLEVKDATFQNLTVTDDAFIGLNNFNVLNGAGTSGQLLSTDGSGHVNWVSNGSGDVSGPVSSVNNHLASFNGVSGKLLADSGVLVSSLITNPLGSDLGAGNNNITNLKGLSLTDQAAIAPPPVSQSLLYSSDVDSRIYALNGALSGGKVALWNLDLNQELKTTSSVVFNDVQTSGGMEDDGGSFTLNDGVAAGSATIGFQDTGVPTKYIDVTGNVMHIRNSAFADILTMNESKNSEFFGDLKVDGVLQVANWAQLYQGNGIIYRPGGASSNNVYATWAEVVFVVNNCNQCTTIYVDDSIVSPALITSNLDCKGRVQFRPYIENAGASPVLKFQQDVQLTNPSSFYGIASVVGDTNLNSNIILSNGSLLIFIQGGNLTNDPASILPVIDIADGDAAILAFYLGSVMATSNAVPLINVGVASTLIVAQYNMSQTIGNDVLSSTDGSAIQLNQYDASGTLFTNTLFTGSVVNQAVDKGLNVVYDDSLAPVLGSTNVQGAIDAVKVSTRSFVVGMGGDVDMALKFPNVNGDADSATTITFGPKNRMIAPCNTVLRNISYVTTAGDNTSEFDIEVNGVSHLVLLGGLSGIIPSMSLPILQGQDMAIQKTINGTMPGVSNFLLSFGG